VSEVRPDIPEKEHPGWADQRFTKNDQSTTFAGELPNQFGTATKQAHDYSNKAMVCSSPACNPKNTLRALVNRRIPVFPCFLVTKVR
jgi:hypothetical protein